MKTAKDANPPLSKQFSARMVTIHADLLNKRSLTCILCAAFLLIIFLYIAIAFLRKIKQSRMSLSRPSRLKTVPSTPMTFKVNSFIPGTAFRFGLFLMIFLRWFHRFSFCFGGLQGVRGSEVLRFLRVGFIYLMCSFYAFDIIMIIQYSSGLGQRFFILRLYAHFI